MSHLSAAAGAHQQRMCTQAGRNERIAELRAMAVWFVKRDFDEAKRLRDEAAALERAE